jgi:hypothetical protein
VTGMFRLARQKIRVEHVGMSQIGRNLFPGLKAGVLCLAVLLGPAARATIVGLNQIVTPEIQPAGVLALSAQAQHASIGNSQQIQFELGITPRFELAWFQGLQPGEGLFSTEVNLIQDGPHLLTAGAVNWSTRGGDPQPVVEYGYYLAADHFVVGSIRAAHHAELLLGYKHQFSGRIQFSTDFQSGPGNSTTVGVTYNFTPEFSINPALYWTNSSRHHLLGYVVLTWNLTVWK